MSLRCSVKIQLPEGSDVDAIGFRDEAGEPVILDILSASGRSSLPRIALEKGRSPTLAITDGAVTLVLFKGDEEIRLVSVKLVPGQVNLLP